MIGLPELKGEVTIATESASVTRSMVVKPEKHPRKVCDAPDKEESQCSDEGLQSRTERDGRRGQTLITVLLESADRREGLRADRKWSLLPDRLVPVKHLE